MKNYYQILGVDRNASADDIKLAYRRLANRHHPDRGGDTAAFQEIQEAYAVLGDEQRRSQYDNPAPQFSFAGGPMFNFDDIFEMFGARFTADQHFRRQVMRMQLWITLYDVAVGGPRVISMATVSGNTNAEITIPAGIDDGDTVRYKGIAPGGLDVAVTFRVRPDAHWQRQGADILCEHTVDFWDLILGTAIKVALPNRSTLEITVDAMTEPNTVVRARGQGLPLKSGSGKGDVLVRLQARIPKDIPPGLRDTLAQMRSK